MSDLISRQAAIDLVRDVCDAVMSGCESWYDPETEDEVYKDIREVDAILKCNKEVRIALRNMPSAQPEPEEFEWCHDCKEYDQQKHCCHRWTKVIRQTVAEIKNAQPEQQWTPCDDCDPEGSGYYIVTEKIAEDVWKVGLRWYSTEHGWHWSENHILAWMPLPEPWKGEDDERA